jgi:hypothetical protein
MSNAIHITRFLRVAGLLGLAAVMAGCASSTPVLDASFGDAVRAARVAQTLNPNASANRDPVTGIDGKAGASAIVGYEKSFTAPVRTFDVGTGGNLTGN